MSFVLDASATFAWAFSDEAFVSALPALEASQRKYAEAPVLWHFEVASALRKASRDLRITDKQVTSFLALIGTLDIRMQHDPPSMDRLLSLARLYNITTYDAAYLELALRLGLPLATLDNDLTKAAQAAGITIFLRA